MASVQSKLRVRFAPTPNEASSRLHAMIETLRSLLLLALFWPVLLPWRALMLGERLAASSLGACLGLLQVSGGLLQRFCASVQVSGGRSCLGEQARPSH